MNRQARWMLAANFVTNIGNGIQTIAVGKLLYDQTGSIATFGWVIVFQYTVTFLLHCVSGPLVDRGDPRRMCVAVDALRGGLVCLATLALAASHPVLCALVVTLAIQLGRPFYRSAQFALEPTLVPPPDLVRYNGLASGAIQGGQLVGMLVCGLVIREQNVEAAFLLNGASFLAASALVALISAAPLPRTNSAAAVAGPSGWLGNFLADWRAASKLVRGDAMLASLILLGAVDYVMVDLLNLAIVPLVDERFGGEPMWLSMLDGGFALGAILSGLFVDQINRKLGLARSIVVGLGAQAAFFLLLALGGHPYLTVVFTFGIGVANTISWTVLVSSLQSRLGSSMRGKMASLRSLSIAATAGVLVPVVAHTGSQSLTYGLLSAAALGATFAVCAFRVTRRPSFKAAVPAS